MKRYLIAVIIISVLVSGLLLGCDSEPASTKTPTPAELQTEIETLRSEIEQLKEQERAEILQQAEAYYAIVGFFVGGSSASSSTEKPTAGISEPTSIQPLTVEAIVSSLTTSSQLWGLVKATEDPYLISTCQPNEWGQIPTSYSYIKDYAEGKYRELMSEYYSQQYIDDQLSMLEQSVEKSPVQKVEEETEEETVVVNPEVEEITPKPKVDITLVVEYKGKWVYQVTTTSSWSWVWYGRSGNESKVFENIRVPWYYRAQISDEGTDPLVVKIIYEGQVVAEDTAIGKDDIAYVFWEGLQ